MATRLTREFFRRSGAAGGKRAAELRTPAERTAIAQHAARARWRNRPTQPAPAPPPTAPPAPAA